MFDPAEQEEQKERLQNRIEDAKDYIESNEEELLHLYRFFVQKTEELRQIVEEDKWHSASYFRSGQLAERATELATTLTKHDHLLEHKNVLERLKKSMFGEEQKG